MSFFRKKIFNFSLLEVLMQLDNKNFVVFSKSVRDTFSNEGKLQQFLANKRITKMTRLCFLLHFRSNFVAGLSEVNSSDFEYALNDENLLCTLL